MAPSVFKLLIIFIKYDLFAVVTLVKLHKILASFENVIIEILSTGFKDSKIIFKECFVISKIVNPTSIFSPFCVIYAGLDIDPETSITVTISIGAVLLPLIGIISNLKYVLKESQYFDKFKFIVISSDLNLFSILT